MNKTLFNRPTTPLLWGLFCAVALAPSPARASFLHGETMDAVADGIAWFCLFLVPIVGITVFLAVHVLPEKIAHKKRHPQTAAIQCLCLLSLVFGGLLWPLAWLWTYTKPVGYKLAYGTDKLEGHGEHDSPTADSPAPHPEPHSQGGNS